jgi:hypothetical protein
VVAPGVTSFLKRALLPGESGEAEMKKSWPWKKAFSKGWIPRARVPPEVPSVTQRVVRQKSPGQEKKTLPPPRNGFSGGLLHACGSSPERGTVVSADPPLRQRVVMPLEKLDAVPGVVAWKRSWPLSSTSQPGELPLPDS